MAGVDCSKCPPPAPAWLATFADLMSLLMCFFVLLLSFAEMDVIKCKQLAGSLKLAFGVQSKVRASDIPRGTSIIAKEFSPGRPTPTFIMSVMQHTQNPDKQTLIYEEGGRKDGEEVPEDIEKKEQETFEETPEREEDPKVIEEKPIVELEEVTVKTKDSDNDTPSDTSAEQSKSEQAMDSMDSSTAERVEQIKSEAQDIAEKLEQEIMQGKIEVDATTTTIIIRLRERGSFRSGSAKIQKGFIPVIGKISTLLAGREGEIRVSGHTDDLPIETRRFRSNWDLSSARAVSVTHELLKNRNLKSDRFVVNGYADTRPLVANKDKITRGQNRRVEIVVYKGPKVQAEVPVNLGNIPRPPSYIIGPDPTEAEKALEPYGLDEFDF